MNNNLKRTLFVLVSIAIVSCSSVKKANWSKIEAQVFVSIPERALPEDDLPAERIEIKLKNRILVANWVSNDSKAPAFFILHGNGETLSDWRPLQAYLLDKGYSSFVFDYSGFGNSTGEMTTDNFLEDANEAYRVFTKCSPQATERIAFAHSLGTSILLEAANKLKPIPNKFVIHGAFTTGRNILVEKNVIDKESINDYPDVLNGFKKIHKLKAPLYITHSTNDRVIPIYMSKELAEFAGSKAQFLALNTKGHNDVYEFPTDTTWYPIFEFME